MSAMSRQGAELGSGEDAAADLTVVNLSMANVVVTDA